MIKFLINHDNDTQENVLGPILFILNVNHIELMLVDRSLLKNSQELLKIKNVRK